MVTDQAGYINRDRQTRLGIPKFEYDGINKDGKARQHRSMVVRK